MIIDSHCHLHDSEFFKDDREAVYLESREAGVTMLCVGTDIRSSKESIEFAGSHEGCYPIVGIHPHEAKTANINELRRLIIQHINDIIGIGEIGLDYFYEHSHADVQKDVLRAQLQLAVEFNLPVSFHVRGAFDDFWPIFDEFSGIKGVLHSFTDTQANLDMAIARGLLIGVNGISTFTKDEAQLKLFKEVELCNILLETDAPFLTPRPIRGKINKSAYVVMVAEHQAKLKSVSVDTVIHTTTANAKSIFGI